MPIYMNYDPPSTEYYCIYCESCGQTWNTPDIIELDHCIYKHDDWCDGHKDKDTGDYLKGDDPNYKTGPIYIYKLKVIETMTEKQVEDIVIKIKEKEKQQKRNEETAIAAP